MKFAALYSSIYPYIFGLLHTFKLHNFTSFFMKPASVDVNPDVSDVTYNLRTFIIAHLIVDCNHKSCSLEIAVQSGKFCFFQFLGHVRIDVQRSGNVRMAQCILDDLDIHTSLAHPCRKCVAQRVATKVR